MPSFLVGAQSGGVQVMSGNPWSGSPTQPTGCWFRVSQAVSGLVYQGYSGGLTINSGVALATGGFLDGIERGPGEEWNVALGPAGIPGIHFTCVAGVSGTLRVYFDPYRKA